jgi:hypothetical protein
VNWLLYFQWPPDQPPTVEPHATVRPADGRTWRPVGMAAAADRAAPETMDKAGLRTARPSIGGNCGTSFGGIHRLGFAA